MRQYDNETTGQQVETQNVASDDLDRNREYHYETIDKCWHCKGTGKVAVEQCSHLLFHQSLQNDYTSFRNTRKRRPAASATAAVE